MIFFFAGFILGSSISIILMSRTKTEVVEEEVKIIQDLSSITVNIYGELVGFDFKVYE
jgi:hypothetical protein